VRQNLIRALPQQNSPLVQVALIELLADIQDKGAIEPLRNMIQNPDTDPEVKKRAVESIKQLNI
jgi:HEAT repeat protein